MEAARRDRQTERVLELYDYESDPDETKNLAAEQPEVVAELRKVLAAEPEAKPQITSAPARRARTPCAGCPAMRIGIGSDHAGFQLKETLKAHLHRAKATRYSDFGTHSTEPVDYPLFIRPVALAVSRGECERGIVLGGSGNGEAIVANRVPGIRCGLCWNVESARLNRAHNDANMLALGERLVPNPKHWRYSKPG